MALCGIFNFGVILILVVFDRVKGHGMMTEPPMRGSMWRYGFKTPKNYNDNGLNCGGFADMMSKGGGKCAPCGDPLWGPREHEAGGKYALGVIARHYAIGQVINVTIELTSNHKGYFEFRLCPNNNPKIPVTQECLDQFPLEILGYGHRYVIKSDKTVMVDLKLALPPGLTCSQCVLQWKWRAAQNKGKDPVTGRECFGCGPQEYFINCADVAIGYDVVTPIPPLSKSVVEIQRSRPNTPTIPPNNPVMPVEPNLMAKQPADPITGMVDAMLGGIHKVGGGYFGLMDPHTLYVDPGFGNAPLGPMEQNLLTGMMPDVLPVVHPTDPPFQGVLQTAPPTKGYSNQQMIQAYNDPLVKGSGFGGPISKPTPPKPSSMTNLMALMTTMAAAAENSDSAYIECQDGISQPTCMGNPLWGEGHNYNEYCSTMCPQGICPMSLCVCTCAGSRHGAPGKQTAGKCRAIESWDPTVNTYCSQHCSSMNYGSDNCPGELCICDNMWPV